jgi:hypothetical protein
VRAREILLDLPEEDRPGDGLLAAIDARRVELDPRLAAFDAALETYAATCYELGRSAARRDLWANAVEFFEACMGTSLEGDARKQLEKIYKKDDAVDALIASGLDIEFEDPDLRKTKEWIEEADEEHSNWEDRYEIDNRNGYEVQSNVGYVWIHQMARAVDQVNAFLRRMYRHKEQGQRMRGSSVYLHSNWDEMIAVWSPKFPSLGPGVQAFFAPADNIVVAYDQRSRGQTDQDTMESVAHELSHQFMRDITKNLVPAWINEGSACYLEGTVLLDNGRVISNLVAEGRLENLVQMYEILDTRPSFLGLSPDDPESKYLEDVITYFRPGSYSGSYYPWGWGLVYFMRNYENDEGERIYREPFEDYVETFKSGGKRALKEEFVEYFVERPAVEGVTTFEEFYEFWKAWIRDLNTLHFGKGDEVVRKLLDRAEIQYENEFYENALETYGRVLRKDPDEVVALWFSAEGNRELDRDDVAMYYYRKVVEWANLQLGARAAEATASGTSSAGYVARIDMGVEELRDAAFERMADVNDDIALALREANDALRESLLGLVEGYFTEDSLPRVALSSLEKVESLVGRGARQEELERQILAEADLDLRERRRLRVDDELSAWAAQPVFVADGFGIEVDADSLSYATYLDVPPAEYRFEVTIEVQETRGDVALVGLFLGAGVGELSIVAWDNVSKALVRASDGEEGPAFEGRLAGVDVEVGEPFQLALDVSPKGVVFFVDGEEVADHEYSPEELRGRIGLVLQNAKARYSDMRFIY